MENHKPKHRLCWKCKWLVLDPGGFFKRGKKSGPCDRCLGQMTIFQEADEKNIWIRYISEDNKRPTSQNKQ
jgi:hypothetical protein